MSDAPECCPIATVGIITRNRLETARRAIESALDQGPGVEVIILDDASTDGTPDVVAAEYPRAKLTRSDRHAGYIVGRMRVLREASAPIVLFIDDDAEFSSSSIVADTVRDFDHPRVAAVAVPFEEWGGPMQGAPGRSDFRVVDFFIGAAHALRRDVVLSMGGFRTSYGFYVEEADLSIRLLASGFVVREGRSQPVVHRPHPDRAPGPRFQRLVRNELLFKWYFTPARHLPMVIGGHALVVSRNGFRRRLLGRGVRGLLAGYWEVLRRPGPRRPVDGATYRLWRQLRSRKVIPFEEIGPRLPPLPAEMGPATLPGWIDPTADPDRGFVLEPSRVPSPRITRNASRRTPTPGKAP
jgi:GT2 family glycosyltransferase